MTKNYKKKYTRSEKSISLDKLANKWQRNKLSKDEEDLFVSQTNAIICNIVNKSQYRVINNTVGDIVQIVWNRILTHIHRWKKTMCAWSTFCSLLAKSVLSNTRVVENNFFAHISYSEDLCKTELAVVKRLLGTSKIQDFDINVEL